MQSDYVRAETIVEVGIEALREEARERAAYIVEFWVSRGHTAAWASASILRDMLWVTLGEQIAELEQILREYRERSRCACDTCVVHMERTLPGFSKSVCNCKSCTNHRAHARFNHARRK